jgi:putative ABC transport system ATP-binding protein
VTALVSARAVEKAFLLGDVRTPVLRGVSAEIAPGGLTAIVGPSGCGKTTFLGLLGGLDRADAGELVVGGVDLMKASPAEVAAYRRHKVGFVFQFYNLLPSLTALENVEASLGFLGLDGAARRKRALDYLDRVKLADAAAKFPAQLSGGMQQRVAIARALAREPLLLLCDEPTGNLDQESGALVFEQLRALQRGSDVTVILVTHDAGLAARSDAVLAMTDGRIAAPPARVKEAVG